jgi:hypothetical protein
MDRIIGAILRGLLYVLFNLLFYFTARVTLPLLTFGRWRVKALSDYRRNLGWFGWFKRQPDRTMLIGPNPAILVGLLIWIFLGTGLIAALK